MDGESLPAYKPLEEYGLIGDLQTCALVGSDGSIDWCCLPHLESPSVFAALLDAGNGGRFQIGPQGEFSSKQSYVLRTNVLETHFLAASGEAVLTDFMPVRTENDEGDHAGQAIIRRVTCSKGRVTFKAVFDPRLDYARALPELRSTSGGVGARREDMELVLQSPFPLTITKGVAEASFSVASGESCWFVLRHARSGSFDDSKCRRLLDDTVRYWVGWAHRCEPHCVFEGPWHDLVERSGLALKLLTHPQTGAIFAAPTTSLPEEIGGVRNWDYRFAWIRDSVFAARGFHALGHHREGLDFLQWMIGICGSSRPSEIRIMYGVHGDSRLEERELPHLSGYRDSRPVRIGNAAAEQLQLDIYGELVSAVHEIRRYGDAPSPHHWQFIRPVVDHVCEVWRKPDSGIWEIRAKPRHYTYSKLMCWVALDRGLKLAVELGLEAPARWQKACDEVRDFIIGQCFDEKLDSFVQHPGSEVIDATSLLIPLRGFLPGNDPRVKGTIAANVKHLLEDNLMRRYNGDDGLPGREGAFVICTFWLVRTLVLSGEIEKAEELFQGVLKYVSPLGLLAEEIDPSTGAQLGNYPQAFSHIGLINSALDIGKARGRASGNADVTQFEAAR